MASSEVRYLISRRLHINLLGFASLDQFTPPGGFHRRDHLCSSRVFSTGMSGPKAN